MESDVFDNVGRDRSDAGFGCQLLLSFGRVTTRTFYLIFIHSVSAVMDWRCTIPLTYENSNEPIVELTKA